MNDQSIHDVIYDYTYKSVCDGVPFPDVYEVFLDRCSSLVEEMSQLHSSKYKSDYKSLTSILDQLHNLTMVEDSSQVLSIFTSLYVDLLPKIKSAIPVIFKEKTSNRKVCEILFLGFSVKAVEKLFSTWAGFRNKELGEDFLCSNLASVLMECSRASFAMGVLKNAPQSDPREIMNLTRIPYFEEVITSWKHPDKELFHIQESCFLETIESTLREIKDPLKV